MVISISHIFSLVQQTGAMYSHGQLFGLCTLMKIRNLMVYRGMVDGALLVADVSVSSVLLIVGVNTEPS